MGAKKLDERTGNDTITGEEKNALRAQGKAARRALAPEYRAKASEKICAAVQSAAAWRTAKTVLVFRAFGAEVDLSALTDAARAQGKTLAWPYCFARGAMKALVPQSADAWSADIYGIASPDPLRSRELPPESIDLVLTPLVAFDAAGHRIGMGAGIYDRFLPHCTRAKKLGVAFLAQRVPYFETEKTDVPLDGVFTEEGLFTAHAAQSPEKPQEDV